MARQKLYYEWELPSSVVAIVTSICADYDRRERAIRLGGLDSNVITKFQTLNTAVDEAMLDIEGGLRKIMLRDIGRITGYHKSEAALMISKNAYYRRRRKIIHDIAAKLSLI